MDARIAVAALALCACWPSNGARGAQPARSDEGASPQAQILDELLKSRDPASTAELQRRFDGASTNLDKQKIASVLVRRLEDDRRYFEFLADPARQAATLDMPFPFAFDVEGKILPKQYSPGFLRWADEKKISPESAAAYATADAPLAVLLLALTDDPRAAEVLLEGVESPNYMVAYRAAWGLARLRMEDAVPRIVQAAERAPRDAGELIARALILFDAPEAQRVARSFVQDERVFEALRARAALELRMNIGEAFGTLPQDADTEGGKP